MNILALTFAVHLPCVPGDDALDFDSKDLTFCGKGCQKVLHLST